MRQDVRVRRAADGDAEAMSRLLIASISELCGPDHGGDPARIAGWTRNKSVAGIGAMLANPDMTLLVAQIGEAVVGVGAVAGGDEVALNYVDPGHVRRGVGRAMLAAMEAEIISRGFATGRLTSTRTALDFYRANGWREDGPAETGWGMPGYPMRKRLAP